MCKSVLKSRRYDIKSRIMKDHLRVMKIRTSIMKHFFQNFVSHENIVSI